MNKLLYIAFVDMSNMNGNPGVIKKIGYQVNAFYNLGFDVYQCMLKGDEVYIQYNGVEQNITQKGSSRRHTIVKSIVSWIAINQVDFCYVRYAYSDPLFVYMLAKVKGTGARIMVEIPTYPYRREKSSGNLFDRVKIAMDVLCSTLLKRYVELMITFTDFHNIFGIRTVQLDNGIDVNSIRERKPVSNSNELHLLGLAAMYDWQGFDRVLAGMAKYDFNGIDNTKIYFHFVGEGSALDKWKQMAKDSGLNDYVIFHGALHGKGLDDVFDQCDIGIGALGYYRLNRSSGSTLKAREYCARGLPFIYAYDEKALHKDLYFARQIPNTSEPVDMKDLLDFHKMLKGKKDLISRMRLYALEHFTWEKQFSALIKEFNMNDVPERTRMGVQNENIPY